MERLVIPAEPARLDEVCDFIGRFMAHNGIPKEARMKVRLAAEEVFINIASYAYEGKSGTAEVVLDLLESPERLSVCFMDEGTAFNPLEKEDADTSEEALMDRIGGLGILLVKNVMDNVSYRRWEGKNILTLEKNI